MVINDKMSLTKSNEQVLPERIIVPVASYDASRDKRLLIPFLRGLKVGFMDQANRIVVEPKYDVFLGEVYTESDFVEVGITYSYAYEKKNDRPYVYTRVKWGLLNSKGEFVLEPNYSGIIVGENTIIVRRAYGYDYDGRHSLLNLEGKTILPFDTYWDIEPFENGLARCRNRYQEDGDWKELYGVINESGEVVLECVNRQIMPFYGKYRARYIKYLIKHLADENSEALRTYFPEEYEKRFPTQRASDESFFDDSNECFNLRDYYDYEGYFDYDRLDDAIMDGEFVPEDW